MTPERPGSRPARRARRGAHRWGPLEALSLLIMFVGAAFLSHSPLVMGIKSEGKSAEYEEMLSRRVRSFGHSSPEGQVPDGGLPFSAI